MNSYQKFLVAAVVLLSLAACSTPLRRPSSDPLTFIIALDAHLHHGSGRSIEDARGNPQLGHSFLIADSYVINSEQRISTEHEYGTRDNFVARHLINQKTSAAVARYPTVLTGLCGFNLSWTDGLSIADQCLALPGMRGLKIHDLSETSTLTPIVKFRNLDAVLELVKNRNIIILWHIRSDPSVSALAIRDYFKSILDRVLKYPNVTFVLAHSIDSMDSTDNLAILNQSLQRLASRPTNLYIETSATIDFCGGGLSETKVASWKSFGVDYILTGSDSSDRSWTAQKFLAEQLSYFKTASSFTEEDKYKILISNGLRVLELVNPEVYATLRLRAPRREGFLEKVTPWTCD